MFDTVVRDLSGKVVSFKDADKPEVSNSAEWEGTVSFFLS